MSQTPKFDSVEMSEWVDRWFNASTKNEYDSLKETYVSSGYEFEDLKSRLMSLGLWNHTMEQLKDDM